MKRLALLALSAAAVIASAPAVASPEAPRSPSRAVALDDGNTLHVAASGWMRMFSPEGKRVLMRDGVPMRSREGEVFVMKEDPNWRQLRLYGTLSPKSR